MAVDVEHVVHPLVRPTLGQGGLGIGFKYKTRINLIYVDGLFSI